MTVYFFIVFGLYFSLVIGLIVGWQFVVEGSAKKVKVGGHHKISVIVPYRNEEARLPLLLHSLLDQEYPKECVEFLLVNDHSTDQSESIVQEFAEKHLCIKSERLSPDQLGKKRAIAHGVAVASNEIIVTTDADCSFHARWLQGINEMFADKGCVMAIGTLRIEQGRSFFSQLQSLEFASLIGSAGATLFYSKPILCNGANLAFRKAVFVDVQGFDGNWEIPSGDDEFLLRKIHSKYPTGIRFLAERQSVVTTQPLRSVRDFLQQRIRWAGKWRFNSSRVSRILAVFIFLFQASYIGLGLFAGAGWISINALVFLLALKLFVEFIFLYQVSLLLGIKWRWLAFFVLQFVYPVYVVWVALWSQHQSFTWKDRITKSKH